MYSEVIDDTVSEEDDVAVGLYSLNDFPEIMIYIDEENQKVIKAWVKNNEDQ